MMINLLYTTMTTYRKTSTFGHCLSKITECNWDFG